MKDFSTFLKASGLVDASPTDCLVSYPGHSSGVRPYSPAEMYFTGLYYCIPLYQLRIVPWDHIIVKKKKRKEERKD